MPQVAATTDTTIRFPDRMRLRVPAGLPAAVETAARQRHTSPSEWARQAILRGLEADGVHLLPNGKIEANDRP